jgi:uncharacterized protein (DUF2062 family)
MVAFVLPKRGYTRGWKYIGRRVQRIRDTPEKIALGFACGALASFTPLFGCHFFVAAFLAWALRANVVAGLFGTIVGNPLSFPFIATASLGLGRWLTGGHTAAVDGEGIISAFADVGGLLWDALLQGIGLTVENPVSWVVTKARFADFWDHVMFPYFVGGLIVGMTIAVICYFVFRPAIAAYQKRRREKLALKKESNGIAKLKSRNKAPVS